MKLKLKRKIKIKNNLNSNIKIIILIDLFLSFLKKYLGIYQKYYLVVFYKMI